MILIVVSFPGEFCGFVDHKLNVSALSSKPTCLHFGLVVRKQVFNKIVFHSNDMKVQNMKY